MNRTELKNYKRDALLGALGAFLMLIGDLCLSVIPASPGDGGLFARGSLSERDMGSVAAAAADCNGALRHGAGIFHRSSILPANTAAAPRNPLGGSGGGRDLHRHGGGAALFYRQPCRLDEHPRSAARTGGNDGADSGAVCSPYARHAKFTWGVKNGGALAGLLPGFRLAEEHSLTEGMAEFVPIYKLLGKRPFCTEYLQQDRRA